MPHEESFPPPAIMPVLSYESGTRPKYYWLARAFAGLAIANGLYSAGYIAASYLPSGTPNFSFTHYWSEWPMVGCACTHIVYGSLGLFRIRGSRLGIVATGILLMLAQWAGLWVSMSSNGPADAPSIAYGIVTTFDIAVIPIFLTICLVREPIKGYFAENG